MRKGILVISAGMPRAGSGWYYNLVHDLSVAGGAQDARRVRERYHLASLLTEVNCNLSTLAAGRLLPVMIPAWIGNTFAIKTHAGPSPFAKSLLRNGRIKANYIYRDPRAAVLSAYEYGRKAANKGRDNAFSRLDSLEASAQFIKPYLEIWDAWMRCDEVLKARFEDLLSDYDREVSRLCDWMELDLTLTAVRDVSEKYRPERATPDLRGTHYNIGRPERFREVFNPEQLMAFNQNFAPQLARMGYEL